MSAEASGKAFDEVKALMPKGEETGKAIILATVKGDIHDIGKNIVKVIHESYGYKVYDLGKDVEPERILECVKKTNCRLVGLSALMTTTVPSMEQTVALIKEKCPKTKVVVGGAVLTKEYADHMGADCYAKDAMETVRFAETVFM